jgi:hypothetical protein
MICFPLLTNLRGCTKCSYDVVLNATHAGQKYDVCDTCDISATLATLTTMTMGHYRSEEKHEKSVGCSRKQRIRNPTKMEMNKFWTPINVGHPKRERQVG